MTLQFNDVIVVLMEPFFLWLFHLWLCVASKHDLFSFFSGGGEKKLFNELSWPIKWRHMLKINLIYTILKWIFSLSLGRSSFDFGHFLIIIKSFKNFFLCSICPLGSTSVTIGIDYMLNSSPFKSIKNCRLEQKS